MDPNRTHLERLVASEGLPIDEQLQLAAYDSGSPGIWTECGLTADVEPDQDRGWCESCRRGTVKSALILAGLI